MKEHAGYRPLDRYEYPEGSGRIYVAGVYYPELADNPPFDATGSFVRMVRSGNTWLREVIGVYAPTHFYQRKLPNGRWERIARRESFAPLRLVQ